MCRLDYSYWPPISNVASLFFLLIIWSQQEHQRFQSLWRHFKVLHKLCANQVYTHIFFLSPLSSHCYLQEGMCAQKPGVLQGSDCCPGLHGLQCLSASTACTLTAQQESCWWESGPGLAIRSHTHHKQGLNRPAATSNLFLTYFNLSGWRDDHLVALFFP